MREGRSERTLDGGEAWGSAHVGHGGVSIKGAGKVGVGHPEEETGSRDEAVEAFVGNKDG